MATLGSHQAPGMLLGEVVLEDWVDVRTGACFKIEVDTSRGGT